MRSGLNLSIGDGSQDRQLGFGRLQMCWNVSKYEEQFGAVTQQQQAGG